ncbi:MAG: TM2 domain-containing protein [Bacteroides sp.]|nr:TM2 domain-containing protein [Bacteroides sp.]
MDAQKVDNFMLMSGKYFPEEQLPFIREHLLQLDDNKAGMLAAGQFKDPTTALLISVFAGSLGIDRFYIGDTGLGIGKLLTCGGFGIWALVDLFLIMGATREKNLQRLQQLVG